MGLARTVVAATLVSLAQTDVVVARNPVPRNPAGRAGQLKRKSRRAEEAAEEAAEDASTNGNSTDADAADESGASSLAPASVVGSIAFIGAALLG